MEVIESDSPDFDEGRPSPAGSSTEEIESDDENECDHTGGNQHIRLLILDFVLYVTLQ